MAENTHSVEIKVSSAEETAKYAKKLADVLKVGDILLFYGVIGAGKTTFIQAMAKGLGVKELVTSPTFVIHRLHTSGRIPLSHVDLYRMDSDPDVETVGFEEYYDTAVTCIEWSERYSAFEPPYLELRFEYGDGETERKITIIPNGDDWEERLKKVFD